jgi:PAS domain S-box-containing protein
MIDDQFSDDGLREWLAQAEATLGSLGRGGPDLTVRTGESLVMRIKSLVEGNERLSREWQTTFDSIRDTVWVVDAEHRVMRSNRAAEGMFHRPVEAMIGKHCWEIVHGTTEPIPECPILRVRKSLRRECMGMRVGDRWFEVSVDPILDEHNGLSGAVHIVSDITERRQAEDALRESERRLATLMANLPGMTYRCRNLADWPMEFVSEGCAGLTGWSASAILQNRPAYGELIVEADRQPVWDAVQQALAARQPFELTYRIQTAEGQIRWVWERGCGVFDAAGSLLHVEGFITDITRQHQAEEALQRHVEDLRLRSEALARFNAAAVDRELRMIELKREVNELCLKLGEPPRHKIVAVPQAQETSPENRK